MRLMDKYRPTSLAGIVGQPAVQRLSRLASAPYASCWLLEGAPGGEAPLPTGWQDFGWHGGEFSLRVALSELENHLPLLCAA